MSDRIRASTRTGVIPYAEVARRWNAISGERIGKSMVQKIEREALKKLAARLAEVAGR